MSIQLFGTNMPKIVVNIIIFNILRLFFDVSLLFYLIFVFNIFIVPYNNFHYTFMHGLHALSSYTFVMLF